LRASFIFFCIYSLSQLINNYNIMEVSIMGKFSDTKYISTIDKLVDTSKSKINNPYYIFSNEQPTRVVYYTQNIEKSTLDEASGLNGSNIGNDSPFKFNKIKDFIIYGIDSISTEYDVGDSGVEAGAIAGDAIILPNTITPRPGDYFKINYLKEKNLFKINGVTPDTLDSGANIYKVEYSICPENYTEESLDNASPTSSIAFRAFSAVSTSVVSIPKDLIPTLGIRTSRT